MARGATILRWSLLALTAVPAGPLQAIPLPPPPPPLPPLESPPAAQRARSPMPVDTQSLSGSRLLIEGRPQRARWLWIGHPDQAPRQLWLPLEVLQGQLGVSSQSLPGGGLELEWFGRRLQIGAADQRPLGDEVAVEVAALLAGSGLRLSPEGDQLSLRLPPPQLIAARSSGAPSGLRRVVLDLSGPALLRRDDDGLLLALISSPAGRLELERLGLQGRQLAQELRLSASAGISPVRVFTLGDPSRVVIDLPGGPMASAGTTATAGGLDPRLTARLGQQIQWDRLVREVEGRRVRINAVRIDPRASDLALKPLSRADGMEGLSSLTGLARRQDALVAINGGFFNRVRRLPLGALRDGGHWLSGPILNRGAIGWQPGGLPRFGRLRLQEWVVDPQGNRWGLRVLNSGYVQRGLSRYTADWGPTYRSISDGESAVLLRRGQVIARFGSEALSVGVPLTAGDSLLVGRGGFEPPWPEGTALSLESQVSHPVGEAPFVIGGGPLLLLDGRSVLDGAGEGFGAAFLSQGAPRTVIGSDGRQLWLITLEGLEDEGPTLAEATLLLRQLGLTDALNLDGGSSTGLVIGGRQTVRGRGVVSAVHNGLGLVPAATLERSGSRAPGS